MKDRARARSMFRVVSVREKSLDRERGKKLKRLHKSDRRELKRNELGNCCVQCSVYIADAFAACVDRKSIHQIGARRVIQDSRRSTKRES